MQCRSSRADYIIPYAQYRKSVSNMISMGARFKMKFCIDESPERRYGIQMLCLSILFVYFFVVNNLRDRVLYFFFIRRFSGVVTSVGDMDPYKWPNSKWRCLMVHAITFQLYSITILYIC